MTVTLSAIWFPIIITLISVGGVIFWSNYIRKPGGSYDFGVDVMLFFLVSIIVSLFAWLIWALLT